MRAGAGTPQLSRVYFASSNLHKFDEARSILASSGIDLEFFRCSLEEIQSDSLKDIASHKARGAFKLCKKPVIVEDAGLQIFSLNKFPGPYSSYVFETIGNRGILNLVGRNRRATFESVTVYCDRQQLLSFTATVHGKLSKTVQGRGWGFDPIFVPNTKNQTFANLKDKNSVSHRYKALNKFSKWFLNR